MDTASTDRALAQWQAAREQLRLAQSRWDDNPRSLERAALAEQLARIEAQERALRAELAQDRQAAPSTEFPTSELSLETPQHQPLAALRLQEQSLAIHMRDNHPQLIALRQRIAELEATSAAPQRPELPTNQRFQSDSDANTTALGATLRSLASLRQQLERKQADPREPSSELAPLEREAARAEAEYERQLQLLAQMPPVVRPAAECQASSAAPPVVMFRSGPSPLAWFVAGIAMAGLAGTLVLRAMRRRRPARIVRSEDLSQLLDLPVLGTLPRALQSALAEG